MVIIKRYPNRKLYDSVAKRYITLEGIAALIRDGQEVQIQDHITGVDLTALTLTQTIFEQAKKQKGFLPRPVLTGLIQAGGETLGSLRRSLASPLGLRRHIDEEIERRLYVLVEEGELAADEAAHLLDKLLTTDGRSAPISAMPTEEELRSLLTRYGVPTQEDIQQLNEQIDALTAVLAHIDLPVEPK